LGPDAWRGVWGVFFWVMGGGLKYVNAGSWTIIGSAKVGGHLGTIQRMEFRRDGSRPLHGIARPVQVPYLQCYHVGQQNARGRTRSYAFRWGYYKGKGAGQTGEKGRLGLGLQKLGWVRPMIRGKTVARRGRPMQSSCSG